MFPDALIGRCNPMEWQPRSPELTALDLFIFLSLRAFEGHDASEKKEKKDTNHKSSQGTCNQRRGRRETLAVLMCVLQQRRKHIQVF